MPSNWTKQPQQITRQYINDGTGLSVVGGAIASVPSGVQASQGIQDVPGDRIVFGMVDAAALSDTSIATLYGGLYQYVQTLSTSTATPTRGRAVFWYNTGDLNNYRVTADEVEGMWAGFPITATITKGYSWYIQLAGLITMHFKASITGTPTVGRGVFLLMTGAGADVGTVNQLVGASTAVTTGGAENVGIDTLIHNYMGVAYELPVNDSNKLVEKPLSRVRF